jgi:MoaA/NifB/PqqE/SkfB family radical SAM enzyme
MKLIAVVSPSHQSLKDDWFLRTLKDDYEVCVYPCDVSGQGTYMQDDWRRAVLFKSTRIIEAIEENWNDTFVYSDVDVIFFAPTKAAILESLAEKDIVCQRDDPSGNLCTGFFGVRANEATLQLWQRVRQSVEREGRDQLAFNRLVREQKDLRAGYLPRSFFGTGTFSGRSIHGAERFYIPRNPAMFHANCTVGVDNKIMLLSKAEMIVAAGGWARWANNVLVGLRPNRIPHRPAARVQASDASFSRPRRVALDLSTVCQLKCPSCPTANGTIATSIGAGFLPLAHFKTFIQDHPWVSDIELSNWGEVFLNKDLEQILRHADRRHVAVRIDNGANLDRASDEALEALVRYKVRSLTCSIDGASPDVYSVYRVNGHFDRVIGHVRRINAFKERYRSPYPALRWQFVAFGHNTHDIGKARAMARELGMEFKLKLSWDDLYTDAFSPVKDRELIRTQSSAGVADRREYEEKFGRSYIAASCHQLWLRPRINFDGRLLGCSINHWGDFGNVFTSGLDTLLSSEKVRRTKEMLLGLRGAVEGSPCLSCPVYRSMRTHSAWVRPEDLVDEAAGGRMNRIRTTMSPRLSAIAARLSRLAGRR